MEGSGVKLETWGCEESWARRRLGARDYLAQRRWPAREPRVEEPRRWGSVWTTDTPPQSALGCAFVSSGGGIVERT